MTERVLDAETPSLLVVLHRRLAARRLLVPLAAGLLIMAVAPQPAIARWSRVNAHATESAPFYVCPAQSRRARCGVIEDPTVGTRHRGPLPRGAITTGPEQEVSPALEGSGREGGYAPGDLQRAYALPSASAGSGQTVAVVIAHDDPNAESDLGAYRAEYKIAPCVAANGCLRKLSQSGTSSYPTAKKEWATEASLDLDMVSAICPNCKILLVEANSEQASDLAIAENEAVALGATEVSNSFLETEELPEYALAYNHHGVPIAAAAGDHGYGAGVGSPASYPGVIAVGGTALLPASNRRGWTETVWGGASGAGTQSGCTNEPKPAWQSDGGCAGRTENDLAAVADPNTPVSVYDSYETSSPWLLLGGTSASTPIVSAAMALASSYTRSFVGARALYAQASGGGGALNDVVSGLDGSCGSYLCEAQVGYDGPTGLGTLNGAPEVPDPTLLATGASSITATEANLNGTVNPHGGELLACRFEYGPAGSGSYPSATACSGLPGTASSPVAVSGQATGLQPSTSYHFRVLVTYTGGSTVGAAQTFTTSGPSPTVSTGPATGASASSVTLSGEVNPNGGPVEECAFEYGPTEQYGSSAACNPAVGGGQAAVAVSAGLKGLTANATYHYRLTARNKSGTASTTDRTLTLLPKPPVVLTGSAVAITATNATLTATVGANGAPLSVCEFEFNSSEELIPCLTSAATSGGELAVSAPASGLRPGTAYRYRVIATNAGGTGYGAIVDEGSPSPGLLQARLTSKTLIVDSGGRLNAKVRCPQSETRCSGTVTLRGLGAGSAGGSASSRPAPTLAVGSFRARTAGLGAAHMRLLSPARAMLARSHLLRVKATVRTRLASGQTVTWQAIVTLRASR
jgi:Subtilase family